MISKGNVTLQLSLLPFTLTFNLYERQPLKICRYYTIVQITLQTQKEAPVTYSTQLYTQAMVAGWRGRLWPLPWYPGTVEAPLHPGECDWGVPGGWGSADGR